MMILVSNLDVRARAVLSKSRFLNRHVLLLSLTEFFG